MKNLMLILSAMMILVGCEVATTEPYNSTEILHEPSIRANSDVPGIEVVNGGDLLLYIDAPRNEVERVNIALMKINALGNAYVSELHENVEYSLREDGFLLMVLLEDVPRPEFGVIAWVYPNED